MASDATGSIPIMLDNFSAMKCFGKRAYDVYNKVWTELMYIRNVYILTASCMIAGK